MRSASSLTRKPTIASVTPSRIRLPTKANEIVASDRDELDQKLEWVAEEQTVGAGRVDRTLAKSPVTSAPQMPPTPCTPTTSSASS